MNTLLALLTVLFTITDPPSDAIGDGTLTPPTAALYASSAVFDIHDLTLQGTDDGELLVSLTLAELEKDADYANGFRSLVADIYLDVAPGGENALYTPGEWLLEPGEGWQYLVRITPDGTYGFTPGTESQNAELLPTEIDGTTVLVHLPISLRVGEEYEPYAYALTGLYDPFAADAWRAVSSVASPWSFSSDAAVPNPVLDITAPNFEQQEAAMEHRVLPKQHVTISHSLGWVAVMIMGLLVAVVGWILRFQKRAAPAEVSASAEEREQAEEATDEIAAEEMAAEVPAEEAADEPTDEPLEDTAEETGEEAPEDATEELAEEATEAATKEAPQDNDDEIIIPFVEREPRA